MGGKVQYKLSFTVGGLGLQECKTLLDAYELDHDWDVVRQRVFDDKSLQVRTESGAKRLIREYVSRLKNLNDEEIQTFRDGTRADQIAILSLSACRTYALIGDFAIEVMNERALSSQMEVHATDFERFIDDKAEWHPGELFPRVGFVVTTLTVPVERVFEFYNRRGTAVQYTKEGKYALKWTRLSCKSLKANEVRLQLHALAYNLANFLRSLVLPNIHCRLVTDELAGSDDQNWREGCPTRAFDHPATRRSGCYRAALVTDAGNNCWSEDKRLKRHDNRYHPPSF